MASKDKLAAVAEIKERITDSEGIYTFTELMAGTWWDTQYDPSIWSHRI